MGYTTEFSGALYTNKPIPKWLNDFLDDFARVRHMDRDVEKIKELYPNWKEKCFNGDLGAGGQYFVGSTNDYGDPSVLDINKPAQGVPGLWCQWVMEDDTTLVWDGGEKFYDYVEWLEYLIKHFFAPSGYALDGDISWQGEDPGDFGVIHVNNNLVTTSACCDLTEISSKTLLAELARRLEVS